MVCAGAIVMFAVPFVVRCYRRWISGETTEQERRPDIEGLRAWITARDLILSVLIALCAWVGYAYSFWAILALCLGALVIYPLINMVSHEGRSGVDQPTPDLTDERERILKLLEEGKVTAEEGAELLNALSQTAAPTTGSTPAPATAGKKLLLVGGALVLIGFFFPWFSVNPGAEMQRFMNRVGFGNLSVPMPPSHQQPGWNLFGAPESNRVRPFTPTVSVSGGDISNGLGWIVLLLSVGVAILPYIAIRVTPRTRHMLMIGALGIGAIILGYLFTQRIRYVGFGLPLVVGGYAIQLVGVVKERSGGAG